MKIEIVTDNKLTPQDVVKIEKTTDNKLTPQDVVNIEKTTDENTHLLRN